MNAIFENICATCDVTKNEAWLFLLLSASGWAFFFYKYIFSSGLGAVLPKYAGY